MECPRCLQHESDPKVMKTYLTLVEAGLELSTKAKCFIQVLKDNRDLNIAVPTQYIATTRFLEALVNSSRFQKARAGRKVYVITGDTKMEQRQSILQKILKEKHILIFTIKTGGMGWNLLNTQLVIIMEPHWNPQWEHQAMERIHRLYHYWEKVWCIRILLHRSVGKVFSTIVVS